MTAQDLSQFALPLPVRGVAHDTIQLGQAVALGYDTDMALGLDPTYFIPPISSEYWRGWVEKFMSYYLYREIGTETVQQFRYFVRRKLIAVMPYYTALYSQLLTAEQLQWFQNQSLLIDKTTTDDTTAQTSTITDGTVNTTSDGTDNTTVNSTDNTIADTADSAKSTGFHSDIPVTGWDGNPDTISEFATAADIMASDEASHSTQSEVFNSTVNEATHNTTNQASHTDQEKTKDVSSAKGTGQTSETGTVNKSVAQYLQEIVNLVGGDAAHSLVNLDLRLLNELDDCFYGIQDTPDPMFGRYTDRLIGGGWFGVA